MENYFLDSQYLTQIFRYCKVVPVIKENKVFAIHSNCIILRFLSPEPVQEINYSTLNIIPPWEKQRQIHDRNFSQIMLVFSHEKKKNMHFFSSLQEVIFQRASQDNTNDFDPNQEFTIQSVYYGVNSQRTFGKKIKEQRITIRPSHLQIFTNNIVCIYYLIQ